MKKLLLFSVPALIVHFVAKGQISEVIIGVNGPTCSQCSRNVEMKLRKLAFVAGVDMNLEHTSGNIKLRNNAQVVPEAIAKSVGDAGFSLRYLKVVVRHTEQYDLSAACFTISGLNFQSAEALAPGLTDKISLQLLGEPYQPRRTAKQNPNKTCNGKVYFVARSNE